MTDPHCPANILAEAVGQPADPKHECPLCEMGVPIREAKPIGPNCPVVVLEGSGIPEAMVALEAALKAGSGVGVIVLDSHVDFAEIEKRVVADMMAAPERSPMRQMRDYLMGDDGRPSMVVRLKDAMRGAEPVVTREEIKAGRDPKGRRWVDANRAPSRPGKRR